MKTMSSSCVVLLGVMLAISLGMVDCHGHLAVPASRNLLANTDYCPHCLNAGGIKAVQIGDQKWPVGHYGLCGDRWDKPQPRPHEAGGEHWTGQVTGNYTQGGTIDITIAMNAFHGGDFKYSICKIEGTSVEDEHAQLTKECFEKHELVMADGQQAPGEKWYRLGYDQQAEYHMTYKLPEDLTCDGKTSKCVLQWYWITSHTCIPPGEPEEYIRPGNVLGTCGITHGYPEEFWNCADITIGSEHMVKAASVSG